VRCHAPRPTSNFFSKSLSRDAFPTPFISEGAVTASVHIKESDVRKRTIRLSEELVDQIRGQAKKRGFATASAFMRAAIEKELSGSETTLDSAEERLAATIDRLAGELRRLRTGQQGLFAFLDALTKTVLTCLPEPSGEGHVQAVARAKARYERFLKSVGLGIAGDTQAALDELTGRIQ